MYKLNIKALLHYALGLRFGKLKCSKWHKKRIAYNPGISNVYFRAISVENTFLFTVISHVYTTENNKALHMFLE